MNSSGVEVAAQHRTTPVAQAAPSPSLSGTLEALEDAVRYRKWIFSVAEPHLGQRILEIGAGTGSMTSLIADRDRVIAVEVEPGYAALLHRRFALQSSVEVIEGSATDRELLLRATDSRIDSAMSFNTLEHIPDDVLVLQIVRDVLPPGGRFVCFVPAFPSLYGAMDKALGHVRRYKKSELLTKMTRAGFAVVDARYMNLPGFFLWFVNGRVLRSSRVAGGLTSVRLHDRFALPVTKAIERIGRPPLGQSLLVVGARR